jgi:hypothetical protein
MVGICVNSLVKVTVVVPTKFCLFDAFEKKKAANMRLLASLCLSVYNDSRNAERIFIKFDTEGFY